MSKKKDLIDLVEAHRGYRLPFRVYATKAGIEVATAGREPIFLIEAKGRTVQGETPVGLSITKISWADLGIARVEFEPYDPLDVKELLCINCNGLFREDELHYRTTDGPFCADCWEDNKSDDSLWQEYQEKEEEE